MNKFTAIIFGLLLSGLGYAQSDPPEIVITKASIKNGKIHIKGHGGIPGEPVQWAVSASATTVVDTVDEDGKFGFVSDVLPMLPRCYAEVIVGNYLQEHTIEVDTCKGTVIGFYTVTNEPDGSWESLPPIKPGEMGYGGASCRPGDAAVSNGFYISTGTNTLANASVLSNSLGIDGLTGIESGSVTIVNHGEVDITLRVFTTCGEVKPPASRFFKEK